MKYYLDQLDPVKFQQLINAILIAKYGDDIRLTPLRGSDGGRDGETAPNNPFTPFIFDLSHHARGMGDENFPYRPGRFMFQVKHHDTSMGRISDLRSTVVSEFEDELNTNVIGKKGGNRVNYFFLITNVTASENAIERIDAHRRKLIRSVHYLHADVWWGERVFALLDTMPSLWVSFPELFPGGKVPIVGNLVSGVEEDLTRTVKIFLNRQYRKDKLVKFRQVEIEHDLEQLFVDLDVNVDKVSSSLRRFLHYRDDVADLDFEDLPLTSDDSHHLYAEQKPLIRRRRSQSLSLMRLLTREDDITRVPHALNRLILEGGPGQGKSTITQMIAQLYRKVLIENTTDRMVNIGVVRLPFRIELREFAEFIDQNNSSSVEEYLVGVTGIDTGGRSITVNDIQAIVERSPVILIFDGLDEVGNDDLRDLILQKINECIHRFQVDLNSNLRVIITTRPPALAGHHEYLQDYIRVPIAPLNETKIRHYMNNWLKVQVRDDSEMKRIQTSFERRLEDKHVRALATNPMQLSILLHFIRIKGEAFPNNRAQLYRSYFETVIDRDVEKSVGISVDLREIVESLHKFLGYKIHSETEAKRLDGTFARKDLLRMVSGWLVVRGNDAKLARELFKLGEERLGLIVIARGEGEAAQYGFEIQPVREYFAAAFINDEIKGDVEPIFQQMVVRPFWREVALFLGGLRRNREKANLILHAKHLDASLKVGWFQHGRNIIMHLLQEGVFSQPPQAYQMALEFVTEALDPQLITRQLELENYVDSLPELINQNPANDNLPKKQVMQMLRANRDTDDEYALQRIYRVACQISDYRYVNNVFIDYDNKDINIMAKVSFVWPFIYGDLGLNNFHFPDSIPDEIFSKWWWYAANRNHALHIINLPERFHQLLLEEYALHISTIPTDTVASLESSWAVWRLDYLSKILMSVRRGRPMRAEIRKLIENFDNAKDYKTDYSGLQASTHVVVSKLINMMEALIIILFKDGKDSASINDIREFAAISGIIHYPGLDGWIAIRGAYVILRVLFEELHYVFTERDDLEAEQFKLLETVRQIQEIVRNESVDLMKSLRFFEIPKKVTNTEGLQIDLIDLLILEIQGERLGDYEWVSRIPLSLNLIPPLVSTFKYNLDTLLKWVGKKNYYISVFQEDRLHVSLQRAILGHVSNSNDPAILRGAFVSLSTSNFVSVAGVNNLLKMLAASKNLPLAAKIFSDRALEQQQVSEKQIHILETVARQILANPEVYGLRLVTIAAKHISEFYPIPTSPIIEQEEELGINVIL